MAVEVILPRVDMDMETGTLAKWHAAEGDSVVKGQTLFDIETDKAAMEIESPADGILRGVSAKPGDMLPVGSVVGWICAPGETLAAAKPAAAGSAAPTPAAASAPFAEPAASADRVEQEGLTRATPKARRLARESGLEIGEIAGSGPHGRVQADDVVAAAAAAAATAPAAPAMADFSGVHAGPAARRLARELGVDLASVTGGGEKGRVTREDVRAAFEGVAASGAARASAAALPEVPVIDFAKYGPVEITPLPRIKRISGPRLHASWVNVPHVTHCDEADVTELEAFRKTLDEAAKADAAGPYRVSLLPLLMKASVATLKAYPIFNSALTPAKDALVQRNYWHIGVAVDTPEGLVVAVARDVDRKGVLELARELGALSAKARAGKLTPSEMQGATFTISSLGGIGGTAFTPIVNAPEVAILGVVRAKMAPVWDGAAFQPRLMLPLCLSYDHRVIDGAAAARFMRRMAETLQDMRRVLL